MSTQLERQLQQAADSSQQVPASELLLALECVSLSHTSVSAWWADGYEDLQSVRMRGQCMQRFPYASRGSTNLDVHVVRYTTLTDIHLRSTLSVTFGTADKRVANTDCRCEYDE